MAVSCFTANFESLSDFACEAFNISKDQNFLKTLPLSPLLSDLIRLTFKVHLLQLLGSVLAFVSQYDFVELLDGSRLIAKEHRALSEPDTRARSDPVAVHQAGFIQYLDSGVWHFAFYNDGRNVETVSYNTIIQGMRTRICYENECS